MPSLVEYDQIGIYCHQCFALFLHLLLNRVKTTQHFCTFNHQLLVRINLSTFWQWHKDNQNCPSIVSPMLYLVPHILLLYKDQDYTTFLSSQLSADNALQPDYLLVMPSLVEYVQIGIQCHQCFAWFLILLLNKDQCYTTFFNIKLSAANALQSEYLLVIPPLVEYDKIGIYCHRCFAQYLHLLLDEDQDYTTFLYIQLSAANALQSEYLLVIPPLVDFDQIGIQCHQCFAQYLHLLLNRVKNTLYF